MRESGCLIQNHPVPVSFLGCLQTIWASQGTSGVSAVVADTWIPPNVSNVAVERQTAHLCLQTHCHSADSYTFPQMQWPPLALREARQESQFDVLALRANGLLTVGNSCCPIKTWPAAPACLALPAVMQSSWAQVGQSVTGVGFRVSWVHHWGTRGTGSREFWAAKLRLSQWWWDSSMAGPVWMEVALARWSLGPGKNSHTDRWPPLQAVSHLLPQVLSCSRPVLASIAYSFCPSSSGVPSWMIKDRGQGMDEDDGTTQMPALRLSHRLAWSPDNSMCPTLRSISFLLTPSPSQTA